MARFVFTLICCTPNKIRLSFPIVLILLPCVLLAQRVDRTPWPIDNCHKVEESCREVATGISPCEVCSNGLCEIRVGIILPKDTKYIVNLDSVSIGDVFAKLFVVIICFIVFDVYYESVNICLSKEG